MQKIVQFFREAMAELSRVTWPTRQQTVHYTVLVVIISISTAIFLGVLDYFFGFGIGEFLSGGGATTAPATLPEISPETISEVTVDSGTVEVSAETPDGTKVSGEGADDTVTVLEEEN